MRSGSLFLSLFLAFFLGGCSFPPDDSVLPDDSSQLLDKDTYTPQQLWQQREQLLDKSIVIQGRVDLGGWICTEGPTGYNWCDAHFFFPLDKKDPKITDMEIQTKNRKDIGCGGRDDASGKVTRDVQCKILQAGKVYRLKGRLRDVAIPRGLHYVFEAQEVFDAQSNLLYKFAVQTYTPEEVLAQESRVLEQGFIGIRGTLVDVRKPDAHWITSPQPGFLVGNKRIVLYAVTKQHLGKEVTVFGDYGAVKDGYGNIVDRSLLLQQADNPDISFVSQDARDYEGEYRRALGEEVYDKKILQDFWQRRDQLVDRQITLAGTLHPARWDCVMATYACPAGMYCNQCSADLAFLVDNKLFFILHGTPNEKDITCSGNSGSGSTTIHNQQCWIKEQKKPDGVVKLIKPGKTYTVQGMLRKYGGSDSYFLAVEKIYDAQEQELYQGVAVYTPEELLSQEERSDDPGPFGKGFLGIRGVLLDIGKPSLTSTSTLGFQASDKKIVVYGRDMDPDQERLRGKEVTVYGEYTLYYSSGKEETPDRHIVLQSRHNPDLPFVPKKPVH